MKSWLKGGLILALVDIVVILLSFIATVPRENFGWTLLFTQIPFTIVIRALNLPITLTYQMIIGGLICWFIIGAIIGWIIQIIKPSEDDQ
jgi:hypothetical protein